MEPHKQYRQLIDGKDVSIRKATLDDKDLIFDIHTESVRGLCGTHYSKKQLDAWFLDRSSIDYTGAIEYGGDWIAYIEEDPVGFVEVFSESISMIFIRPSATGKGIGQILLDFALARLKERGCSCVKLEATLNAQSFYEKNGFKKVGNSHLNRSSGIMLETVLMEQEI